MKHFLVVAALVALTSVQGILAAEVSRGIPESAVVRDEKEASRSAQEFFTQRASGWVKEGKPFRAQSVIFARSPASGAGLKMGEPIWIVVVVNDMESNIYQTPVGILWIRATDGAVFETEPKHANQSPMDSPTSERN
jgi:hypothetical protein